MSAKDSLKETVIHTLAIHTPTLKELRGLDLKENKGTPSLSKKAFGFNLKT